jgi:hypothetical protein
MQNYNSYHQLRFNKGCLNEEIGDVIKVTSALQCWEQLYKKFTTVIYYPIKITVVITPQLMSHTQYVQGALL